MARFPPEPLRTELDAAPIATHLSFCTADTGEILVLQFGYADGARLTVTIHTAGCRYASNGDLIVETPPATIARLRRVLGGDQNG